MSEVDIDIVVVNYRTYPIVQAFIDSYYKHKPTTPSRLILVDNASNAKELESLNVGDAIVEPMEENVGYARACNRGASMGESKYIALMNSDVEFVNDTCIDQCVQFMEDNPDVGVVGPFQYCVEGKKKYITNAGILGTGDKPKHRAWKEEYRGQYRHNEEVLMVMGSAMIIRREAWNKIMDDPVFRKHWPNAEGAMPEHPLYYEDTMICYAMPYFGYKVFYLGEEGAELIHQWHQTISKIGDGNAFSVSRRMFRDIMDDWGIVHD